MKIKVLFLMLSIFYVQQIYTQNDVQSDFIRRLNLIEIRVNGSIADTVWSMSYKKDGIVKEQILKQTLKDVCLNDSIISDCYLSDTIEFKIPFQIKTNKYVLLPVDVQFNINWIEKLNVDLGFPENYYCKKKHKELLQYSYSVYYPNICIGADCLLDHNTSKCPFEIINRSSLKE